MPFEWISEGCMRRIFTKLAEAGVPTKMTPTEACAACQKPECDQKRTEPFELTTEEKRTLDGGGVSVAQLEKARQDKLERQWKKEDRNRFRR